MDGVVVYDSVYGNTRAVAEKIASSLEAEGHSVRLVHVKEVLRSPPVGDFMFIGSPTRVGDMTRKTKKLVKVMDASAWSDRPMAAFDTELAVSIRNDGASAAAKIHDLARSRGLRVQTPVLKVAVLGMKGPLSPDADEVVSSYVREFLTACGRADPAGASDEIPRQG